MDENKEKQENEKKNKIKLKNIILDLILIIFLVMIIVSSYKIFKWCKSSKKTNEIISQLSDTITITNADEGSKFEVNFEELKNINSDVVAWVKVNGTTVEYPIVKGTNNDFYLAHSLNKEYNLAGWIFADYRNKFDGTDKNIIVYGHNMRDGTMFNTLKDVIKPEWYENEENHKIIYATPEGVFEYQAFAAYQIEAENYDTTINFSSDNQFKAYVDSAINRSVYNFNTDVTNEDKILTLSTCADNNQYRVILQAKKIEEPNI